MSLFSHGNFRRAAALCIAVALAPAAAGAREFRVADTQAEDYPTVQALMFMARQVEERTGGRHHIRVLPGDRVRVAVSPYDLSHGLIVYRGK